MKRLWTIPALGMLVFLAGGCGNFRLATNPNKTYTSQYNYPGTRIAPYNDPTVEFKARPDKVKVCTGVPSENGFHCQ